MVLAGIRYLATFNIDDFSRFPGPVIFIPMADQGA